MRTFTEIQHDIEELTDKRRNIRDQLRSMLDAVGDDRALTLGESEKVDRLEAGADKIERQIADLRDEYRKAGMEHARSNPGALEAGDDRGAARSPAPSRGTTPAQATALRSIQSEPFASDDAKQLGTLVVEQEPTGLAARWAAAAADPHYARAFAKLVVDPDRGHLEWTEAERASFTNAQVEQRAMAIGTGSTGGFMVPFALDPAINLTNDGAINPIRQVARRVTTIGNQWAGVTSAGVVSEWKAEGAQVADASPTLAQPDIDVHLADSFVPFSFEAQLDAANLVNELSRIMQDSKDVHEASAFVNGDGIGKPHGLVARLGAAQTVETATASTFAADDVYTLAEAVPARFRPRARYLASLPVLNVLDQFETTGGMKLFSRVADADPQLLRRPLHEVSDMSGGVTTAGQHIMVAGDLSQYVIVDRIGATMELVPHLFGEDGRPTGQRGALLWWRVGADVLVPNAFRRLTVKSA